MPAFLVPILSLVAGRAAKAGLAAVIGALSGPTAITVAEHVTETDMPLTITGYLVIGLANGLIAWAGTYFKANREFPDAPKGGLY